MTFWFRKIQVSRLYINSRFLQGYSLFKSCHPLYIHTVMINLIHKNSKCADEHIELEGIPSLWECWLLAVSKCLEVR